MERSNGAVKTAFDIQVDGKRGPVRPKMTLKQLTETDCRKWLHNLGERARWQSSTEQWIDRKSSEVYCLVTQFRRENADVVDDKLAKNDAGEMSMSKESRRPG